MADVIRLTIRPGRVGRFEVFLPDGTPLFEASKEPLSDAATLFASLGVDPEVYVVLRYEGASYDAIRAKVGRLAGWMTKEGPCGPEYHRRLTAHQMPGVASSVLASELKALIRIDGKFVATGYPRGRGQPGGRGNAVSTS